MKISFESSLIDFAKFAINVLFIVSMLSGVLALVFTNNKEYEEDSQKMVELTFRKNPFSVPVFGCWPLKILTTLNIVREEFRLVGKGAFKPVYRI